MKNTGLKIINRKSQNTPIYCFKYKLPETAPCIGNWDNKFDHFIIIPRKFYMTFTDYWKKETRRKHYKNKIKSI